MSGTRLSIAAVFMVGMTALAVTMQQPAGANSTLTFNKDVLPILQENCQSFHRPCQIAPMSFLTYQDARPWAKAMKAAVQTQKMPPWFADSKVMHYANDRSLDARQIETIVRWADGGAAASPMASGRLGH